MQHIFFATEDVNMLNKKIEEIHYTDTIHYELEQTARIMKKLTVQLLERLEINMSVDECFALDMISCNDGICQRDLAKLLIKDRANTGRILDSLESKGLIKRYIDTKNNRLVKKMGITESGAKFINEIITKIRKHFEEYTPTISHEEINKVHQIIRDFRLNLEKVVEIKI